jgi:hypothetical protein
MADGTGNDRLNRMLAIRVRDGLRSHLEECKVMGALQALFLDIESEQLDSKVRREMLDLSRDVDLQRWQILHNDTKRYQIISTKDSHQRGENYCHVIYLEKGADLPLVKSEAELRVDDQAAIDGTLEDND